MHFDIEERFQVFANAPFQLSNMWKCWKIVIFFNN